MPNIKTEPLNAQPQKPFTLADQIVVFTGKLAAFQRREAQELVRKNGGTAPAHVTQETTLLVIGDEGYLKEIVKSSKLKRVEEINAEGGNIRIISETEFLHVAGVEGRETLEEKYYSLARVQSVFPNIRPDLVKYFARWGLFKPAVKTNAQQYFQFKDLLVFRQINEMLNQRLALRQIAARLVPAPQSSSQSILNFDEFKPRGQILTLHTPPQPVERTAEEWYTLGYEYDTTAETYDKAIEAYENALTQNPNYVSAMINLANIYYAKRELNRARQLLERACQLEAENHTIFYNLGNLYDELSDFEKSMKSYQRALELHPEYEPALFNLALVHERLGLVGKAETLWRKYLKVDPLGEWAEIAREHLRGEPRGATG